MRLSLIAFAAFAFVPQDGAPPAPQEATHTVAKGTLTLAVDAEATLEAVGAFEARIKLKAYQGELAITQIAAAGAAVKKGDVVLQFDPAALKKQLAAAENELESAKANLTKADEDAKLGEQADAFALRLQEHELHVAESEMKYWQEIDGPHMLKNQELWLKASRDGLADQKDELDQLEKMYKSEELTNATADIVMKRAKRQYEQSVERLKMTEASSKKDREFDYPNAEKKVKAALEKARQDMAAFKLAQAHGKALRRTGLVAVRAAAAQSEEHVANLKADLEALTVAAPFDGVVLYGQLMMGAWQGNDAKQLQSGERVQPLQVLLTVYSPGKLKARIDLPESQLFWIKAGAKASVTPVALQDVKYEGTCGAPSLAGMFKGAGQTFDVSIELPAVDGRLAPGMKASVHVDVAELTDVLLVPAAAVSRGRVWLKSKDGKEEIRAVTIGKSDGQWTEVKSGLSAGDVILPQAKK